MVQLQYIGTSQWYKTREPPPLDVINPTQYKYILKFNSSRRVKTSHFVLNDHLERHMTAILDAK